MISKNASLISFDVEEWFHLFGEDTIPPREQWDSIAPRAPDRLARILDMLDRRGAHATFFVLGWFARRHPDATRSLHERGHEVACHSDTHRLLYTLSPSEVLYELRTARDSLEQVCGARVHGFRAPAFSIRRANSWAFDSILEAGFAYDSSVFPARRLLGGMPGARLEPHRMQTPSGALLPEVPVSAVRLFGMSLPFGGGGYFRLAPGIVTRVLADVVRMRGRPFVSYVHPRDIDADTPRLPTGLARWFQWYVGVRRGLRRLEALLDRFPPVPFRDYLEAHGLLEPATRDSGYRASAAEGGCAAELSTDSKSGSG